MNVKLSKKELDDMSGAATDVQGYAKDAQKIISDAPDPKLTGWQTQDAIIEVSDQWEKKAGKCAGRWEYFAVALTETGEHVSKTDEANAFYFPDLNVGVRD